MRRADLQRNGSPRSTLGHFRFKGMAQGFRVDGSDAQRVIRRMRQDHPFAVAYGLTKTAQDIKVAEIDVMKNVFDRPTRFTLNALFVKPATKTDLTAVVEFKEGFGSVPAWRYLGPQVAGGSRSTKSGERRLIEAGIMKSSEVIVPGQGIKRDAYGNVPGSIMNRILSDLGARADKAQNTTAKSRKRNAGRNRGRYLVLRPGGVQGWPRSDRDVHPGIYHQPAGGRGIIPVLMFVAHPRYQKRFPFYEVAQRVADARLMHHLAEGWQRFVVKRAA
jgi:hypothetical protein